ncbi:MAG: hypothetical protein H7Y09_12730 [Chitinophagaceae bacterium]|nr:hypothetical protein [Anaerolineae bacterium]
MTSPFFIIMNDYINGVELSKAELIQCRVFSFSAISLIMSLASYYCYFTNIICMSALTVKIFATSVYSILVSYWVFTALIAPADQATFENAIAALLVFPGTWIMPVLSIRYWYLFIVKALRKRQNPTSAYSIRFYTLFGLQAVPLIAVLLKNMPFPV